MLRPSQPPTRRIDDLLTASESRLSRRQLGPSFQVGGNGRLQLQVAWAFLLIASAPGVAGGMPRMALYAGILFCSLLAHELGHALCGIVWGSRALIVIHVLGGRTIIEPRLPRRRAVVAALMGPCVSITSALALAALRHALPAYSWLTIALWVNSAWGVVNLLPMLPFDGGRAVLIVLQDEQRSGALLASGGFALVLTVQGLLLHNAMMLFVFAPAAFACLLAWAKRRTIETEQRLGLMSKIDEARRLLSADQPARSLQLAKAVAERARTNTTANAAWELAAWAELALNRPADAYATLARVRPASEVDRYSLAAVEAARGQPRRAITLLEAARSQDALSADGIKLLIDLYARIGSLDRACAVANVALAALEADDTRRVIEAAFEANALYSATELAGKLFARTGNPDDAASQAYGLARLGDRNGARRIFQHLATLLSSWQMHKKTLARLRDLAARPDSREIIGPELSHFVLAHAQ